MPAVHHEVRKLVTPPLTLTLVRLGASSLPEDSRFLHRRPLYLAKVAMPFSFRLPERWPRLRTLHWTNWPIQATTAAAWDHESCAVSLFANSLRSLLSLLNLSRRYRITRPLPAWPSVTGSLDRTVCRRLLNLGRYPMLRAALIVNLLIFVLHSQSDVEVNPGRREGFGV